ncbi:hypothetical protein V2J09_017615 [Rumex salicifolius]
MMKCIVLLLVGIVIVGGAMKGVHGGAIVSGTVFCDQCKDGRISLFDYPLYGVNVGMVCPAAGTGSNTQMQVIGQETTNMFGGYNMRFDGTPDLSGCYTQVSAGGGGGSCQASAGPAQSLTLTFSFFGMEFYSADPLISQPAQPMSFCPGGSHPPDVPVAGPAPFLEPSACSHEVWMRADYRCHWRVVKPDMKVGLVFGPLAAQKYGGDVTLWAGLQGRADPYRTLLREGVTSLLNSYNSLHFPYTPLGVLQRFNMALIASPRTTLLTALRFKRANSAYASSCALRPCKY